MSGGQEGGQGSVRGLEEVGVEGVDVVERHGGVRGVGGVRAGGAQHGVRLGGSRRERDSTAIWPEQPATGGES